MRSLYLGGPTIQEVDGKMMMGLSIYGVAVISWVKLFMQSLYSGGPTIQEVDGKMMMGLSIYEVAVISGSRFYGILLCKNIFIK